MESLSPFERDWLQIWQCKLFTILLVHKTPLYPYQIDRSLMENIKIGFTTRRIKEEIPGFIFVSKIVAPVSQVLGRI